MPCTPDQGGLARTLLPGESAKVVIQDVEMYTEEIVTFTTGRAERKLCLELDQDQLFELNINVARLQFFDFNGS